MDLCLPEKKLVASLLEQPQTIAFEIRIDRIDLFQEKLIDVEEIVLWVQVLDLPCMEMLPYQRERFSSQSTESFGSAEGTLDQVDNASYSVKINKKLSSMSGNEPDINKSDTEFESEAEQMRKLQRKRKSVFRKEKIKKLAKKHEMESNEKALKRPSLGVSYNHGSRKKSSNKSLSFKASEPSENAENDAVIVDEDGKKLHEMVKDSKSRETFRDEDSVKKFRLLAKLLIGKVTDDAPEGTAFNSDCCILIPCSSVANTLYKMERMPLIIYVIELNNSCTKLIGKMCLPMDYSFQEAVVKAGKLKAGVVTHAVQQSFPIHKSTNDGVGKLKVGNIFGSINLICYGRFGMTEIKGPSGDLMTGKLREWRNDCRNNSQGLKEEGVNISEQPYGFKPIVTRNIFSSSNGLTCPSLAPPQSMMDFIQNYHDPTDTTLRLKTII